MGRRKKTDAAAEKPVEEKRDITSTACEHKNMQVKIVYQEGSEKKRYISNGVPDHEMDEALGNLNRLLAFVTDIGKPSLVECTGVERGEDDDNDYVVLTGYYRVFGVYSLPLKSPRLYQPSIEQVGKMDDGVWDQNESPWIIVPEDDELVSKVLDTATHYVTGKRKPPEQPELFPPEQPGIRNDTKPEAEAPESGSVPFPAEPFSEKAFDAALEEKFGL